MSSFTARDILRTRPLTGPGAVIGLFGPTLHPAMVRAAGAVPRDVMCAPGTGGPPHPEIARIAEPFLEHSTRRFLDRLARGAFDGLDGIVFDRNEGAAHHAYLYATELRRQGRIAKAPAFFLWNLARADTPAARHFNARQFGDLADWLKARTGTDPRPGLPTALAAAREAAATRAAEAAKLDSAAARFALTHAARWCDTPTAMDGTAPPDGPRLGLIGTATDDIRLYQMLDRIGPLVADLQPLARDWDETGARDADTLLAEMAADPLHIRALPPDRFRPAHVVALKAAGVDRVLIHTAAHDEAWGWEIPALIRDLAAEGIDARFPGLNSGPDWIDRAEAALKGAA